MMMEHSATFDALVQKAVEDVVLVALGTREGERGMTSVAVATLVPGDTDRFDFAVFRLTHPTDHTVSGVISPYWNAASDLLAYVWQVLFREHWPAVLDQPPETIKAANSYWSEEGNQIRRLRVDLRTLIPAGYILLGGLCQEAACQFGRSHLANRLDAMLKTLNQRAIDAHGLEFALT